MLVILKKFYNNDLIEDDNFKFSPSGTYYAPKHTEFEGYIEYIKGLP